MKIYVQSKTGRYNATADVLGSPMKITEDFLKAVMRSFRADGGYTMTNRNGELLMVPFEEIEFIREFADDIV